MMRIYSTYEQLKKDLPKLKDITINVWEDFDKTFQFALQLCGITTNVSSGKKERLIVSEVESNDELTTLAEDTRLEFRKQACEEIKELFGLDVQVENKVQDVKPTQPQDNKQEPKEPKEN